MFEIAGDDIALLNDTDLRALVGRLCEAELRRQGHSVSHATWGGNQTAKDGGLDVHVDLPSSSAIRGFISRPATGFQVKKPDMPRKEILDEMRPGGVVRPIIVELAKASGAYIIVSAAGSTAFSALKNRKKAMAEAVEGAVDASKLVLDFYDRNRVATWLRDHPGLIPWARALVGKSLPGWQSFGSWSRAPGGVDDSYLFDGAARIKTGGEDERHVENRVVALGRSLDGRAAIYLDTKFWIVLRDCAVGRNSDPAAQELLVRLCKLVRDGEAFCPISESAPSRYCGTAAFDGSATIPIPLIERSRSMMASF